jgi:hypothetical protein
MVGLRGGSVPGAREDVRGERRLCPGDLARKNSAADGSPLSELDRYREQTQALKVEVPAETTGLQRQPGCKKEEKEEAEEVRGGLMQR